MTEIIRQASLCAMRKYTLARVLCFLLPRIDALQLAPQLYPSCTKSAARAAAFSRCRYPANSPSCVSRVRQKAASLARPSRMLPSLKRWQRLCEQERRGRRAYFVRHRLSRRCPAPPGVNCATNQHVTTHHHPRICCRKSRTNTRAE